ncbi:hypothetical protein BIU97_08265 [Curtobacterium sp. MCBA15_009]|nr:hypothetical protein BIU92_07190 [Curtobacterium sp. MCBA15_003]OII10872.1 hypothetical protein BIU97_08265 [Curtobacterium sp. MCBA15_009]OII29300.1 hypothetical protein BIU94_12810 [Curtobacterium sp. MMLR14_006]
MELRICGGECFFQLSKFWRRERVAPAGQVSGEHRMVFDQPPLTSNERRDDFDVSVDGGGVVNCL